MNQVLDAMDIPNRIFGRKAVILDFGCGTGHLVSVLKDRGLMNYHIVGIDLSPKAIEVCRERYPEHTWIVGGINEVPAQSFDFALAFGPMCYYQGKPLYEGVRELITGMEKVSSNVGFYLLWTDTEHEPRSNNVFVRFNDVSFSTNFPGYQAIGNLEDVKKGFGKSFDDADLYAVVKTKRY